MNEIKIIKNYKKVDFPFITNKGEDLNNILGTKKEDIYLNKKLIAVLFFPCKNEYDYVLRFLGLNTLEDDIKSRNKDILIKIVENLNLKEVQKWKK